MIFMKALSKFKLFCFQFDFNTLTSILFIGHCHFLFLRDKINFLLTYLSRCVRYSQNIFFFLLPEWYQLKTIFTYKIMIRHLHYNFKSLMTLNFSKLNDLQSQINRLKIFQSPVSLDEP